MANTLTGTIPKSMGEVINNAGEVKPIFVPTMNLGFNKDWCIVQEWVCHMTKEREWRRLKQIEGI